ncbi:hypothetical protein EZ313_05650 [Ramlibacter henchirensis]|uniref:YXWGXW repeat-containing protein n=1 Tax=Ramlibacter henchirensis TaxID=204072 RepID=A0A4Z0C385_9BURK|nr:hypothetical protein [Ramlibacter henchirensis]TFZ06127.1 hypothetical protein EZ313_05650 [Ramlibacter henchirensis]
MKPRLAAILLAIGTLGAAGAANAGTGVHITVGVAAPPAPVVHVPPQPVYVPARPAVYAPAYEVYDEPHGHYRGHGGRSMRGAPRWDPHVRYMPGQVVRRHGELWVARRVSARVWNENSPPEWTPQYWARAEYR